MVKFYKASSLRNKDKSIPKSETFFFLVSRRHDHVFEIGESQEQSKNACMCMCM